MQFMRLGDPGQEQPVVVHEDEAFDLAPLTRDVDGAFLAGDGIARTRTALTEGALQRVDVTGRRVGPPVARPGAVICIGQNYARHAKESGAEPPQQPIVFLKHPMTVVGPDDDVLIPPGSAKTDWEIELAVVIGRTAAYLRSPEEALAHVAGYAVANDVSERDFQLAVSGGQWSKGKCCATFNPLGPVLVPADEIPDVQDLRMRTWVNGELRQDSTTADMIFSVAHLVWDLSQYMTLYPGDVINTGTPEGVALSGRFDYLRPGDVMELQIEGLGRQRQVLRSAEELSGAAAGEV